MVVVLLVEPDTPLIVTVLVVTLAVLLAVKVNVLVPVPGFGLNDAATPACSPDADNVTLPLNPLVLLIVMGVCPLVPRVTDRLVGDADRVKLPAAVTVNETVVVADKLPCVPLMVTVDVPVVAVALAVSVRVLGDPLATLVGLNA